MAFDTTTKKRRHHFVWQHYLRAWADDQSLIFAARDGKVFRANTSNVAVSKDFYRLKDLTQADLRFVEATCIRSAPAAIQPLLREWIPIFHGLTMVREALANAGIDPKRAKGAEVLDVAANNAEEDLHGIIEGNATRYLDALRNQDLSFTENDDDLSEFLHYVCVQYTRTNNRRIRMVEAFADVDTIGANIGNCWGLMSHVFATNMAYGIFVRRKELEIRLLRAGAGTNFVTADQPVINEHAVELPADVEAEAMSLFYPITPALALVIDLESKTGTRVVKDIEANEVERYNALMAAGMHEMAFGAREADLQFLITADGT